MRRCNSNLSKSPIEKKVMYSNPIQCDTSFFYHFLRMTLKYFFLNLFALMFISAINKVNDLMYIVGDMNVVELVTLLREELVCSHASLLIFSS